MALSCLPWRLLAGIKPLTYCLPIAIGLLCGGCCRCCCSLCTSHRLCPRLVHLHRKRRCCMLAGACTYAAQGMARPWATCGLGQRLRMRMRQQATSAEVGQCQRQRQLGG
jgi:hypothetical protein